MITKSFKNCVSLIVSKNRSQKLIKPFEPEQQSSPVSASVFVCEYVYCIALMIDIIMATS